MLGGPNAMVDSSLDSVASAEFEVSIASGVCIQYGTQEKTVTRIQVSECMRHG